MFSFFLLARMSVNSNINGELEPLIQPPSPEIWERQPEASRRSMWLAVELPLFLLLFSSSLTDTVLFSLLLYRACIVDLEYNSTKCALLNMLNKTSEAKQLETVVQSEASILVTAISVFSSIMPAALAVFLGSWSDKYGRKPLVVWPLFEYNSTKRAILNMLNKASEAKQLETDVQSEASILVTAISVFSRFMPDVLAVLRWSWSDKYGRKPFVVWLLFGQCLTAVFTVIFSTMQTLSAYWFILCIMPLAIFGGFSTIMLGANLITTDMTNEDNRSFRLTLIQGCGFAGVLTGTIASSYMYDLMGYVPLFTLSAAIYIFTLIYTIVLLKESLVTAERGGLTKIFNIILVKEMGCACFKKRDISVASILTLLIIAFGLTMFCIFGISAVDYLFTRQKFQWLLKDYSIFYAANTIIGLIGMFLGMLFFQSYCKMTDGMLLILSYVSSVADATVRSLSRKSWHMYLAGMLSILGSLSPPLIRSQISKVLPENEVAKMYSLVSCVEAAMPIFAPILFNWAYYYTLTVFPGFIYVISGALFSVCLVLVIIANIFYYRMVNNRSRNRLLEEDVCDES